MKICSACQVPIYKYNRSGLCKPCYSRSPERVARLRTARRLLSARLALETAEFRLARFQIKRGPDECWGWTGCHNGVGYAKMTFHKRQILATHLALESAGRPRPSPQHVACHSCDNPICTNPAHLWWGTEKENMQDASAKGRLKGNRKPRVRKSVVQ